jgi:hypothetical protein
MAYRRDDDNELRFSDETIDCCVSIVDMGVNPLIIDSIFLSKSESALSL